MLTFSALEFSSPSCFRQTASLHLLIQFSGIHDFLKVTYLFDCKQYTKHLFRMKVINPLIFLIFAFLPSQ